MPGLAVTPQFMCRPPGFRLVLPRVRWLTPPAGIFRPPGCTIAGLVRNNESVAPGYVEKGRWPYVLTVGDTVWPLAI